MVRKKQRATQNARRCGCLDTLGALSYQAIMKRLWPAAVCLLFAGCAMMDDYDSFYEPGYYDGGFYAPSMPAQAAYMPSTPPISAPCNSCGASGRQPVQQAGYQTGEPPLMKQSAEPPR